MANDILKDGIPAIIEAADRAAAKAIADAWLAETLNFDPAGKSAGNVCAIAEVDAKYSKR